MTLCSGFSVRGYYFEGPNLSKVLEKQEVPVGKWQESEKQRKKNGLNSSAKYRLEKSKNLSKHVSKSMKNQYGNTYNRSYKSSQVTKGF